jgi:ABC-type lipopolysaccharide export system ATPase subunit
MPGKAKANGGNGRLEEALTLLAQNTALAQQTIAQLNQSQAVFQQTLAQQNQTIAQQNQNFTAFQQTIAQQNQNHATLLAEIADLKRETFERLARVERHLVEQARMLEALPEAVRQKIGFKPAKP